MKLHLLKSIKDILYTNSKKWIYLWCEYNDRYQVTMFNNIWIIVVNIAY